MPRRKVLKDVTHGIAASYRKGCRCELCRKINNETGKKYRGAPQFKRGRLEFSKEFNSQEPKL
jgi:hypothetical protein